MNKMKTMNKYTVLVLLFVGYFSYSCTDTYDEHYDNSGASLPEKTLKELIAENDKLSTFSKLIEIAAYDSLFSSSQVFTVWVPLNDALSDVRLESIDREQARLIVGNHFARFNNSTATPDNKLIRMRNNKTFFFSEGASVFGGAKIAQKDILAKNGVLHILESQIPYFPNLYEYIKTNPNTSKLAEFLSSFDEEIFDESLSIPIDVTDGGKVVYDTVTTFYNRLFDANYFYGMRDLGLGHIYMEDSLFTMIVPTNEAWDAAYTRIAPYYEAAGEQEYKDSIQKMQTSLAILEDLIYRGKIENPASSDYLISTSPSVIYNTAELFFGTEKIQASNGLIFQTDELRYDNTLTWNKLLYVESNYSDGRTLGANTSITPRVVDDSFDFFVSDYSYLYVDGSTPSAQPGVTFDIPNVLSGTYDIYVEFLPLYLDPQGAVGEKTKLLFELTYTGLTGRPVSAMVNTADLVTRDTEPTRLKVFSNFKFPVSNCYDRLWMIDYYDGVREWADWKVTTKLLVKTNVSNTELNNNIYTRKFCIDRIIFEPIHE